MANTSVRVAALIRRLRNPRQSPLFLMAVTTLALERFVVGVTGWSYLTNSKFTVWNSTFFMTVFDIFVLGTAFCAGVFLYKRHRVLKDLGFTNSAILIFVGSTAMALYHLGDLFAMHVLPVLVSQDGATAAMAELHLIWSWPTATIVAGSVALGLACLCLEAIPKVSSNMRLKGGRSGS